MKYELNRSYNGGGVVYLLKSEASRSSLQYIAFIPYQMSFYYYQIIQHSKEQPTNTLSWYSTAPWHRCYHHCLIQLNHLIQLSRLSCKSCLILSSILLCQSIEHRSGYWVSVIIVGHCQGCAIECVISMVVVVVIIQIYPQCIIFLIQLNLLSLGSILLCRSVEHSPGYWVSIIVTGYCLICSIKSFISRVLLEEVLIFVHFYSRSYSL